jgi:hypothetical protein
VSDYLLWLRNLMNHLDRAMADEGIEPSVRDRVVSRIMYGTPERDDSPGTASVNPSVNTGGL